VNHLQDKIKVLKTNIDRVKNTRVLGFGAVNLDQLNDAESQNKMLNQENLDLNKELQAL
jgi:hypothetical protein